MTDGKGAVLGWCLYDWANSAFTTVITTFVFAVYFTGQVAVDTVTGTAQWSQAIAVAGLAVALLSPVLGAVADRSGRRKPWLALFTVLTVVPTALLATVRPDPAYVPLALVLVAVASVAYELAGVFYNAMLPGLAPPDRIGRVSGWGWGVGYFGGLACLVVALFLFIKTGHPLFGLIGTGDLLHVRATALLVAVWFGLFALPLFVLTPDQPGTGVPLRVAVRQGIATLADTARRVGRYGNVLRYLIASAFYRDGLNTLFAFGGIYAAGTFGMSFEEILVFAIALNVIAGVGAFAFAWIDDWIGARRTVMISLVGLIAFALPLLFTASSLWFWVLALGLGVFVGPAQAAGRSLMARLAPAQMETEMFGLYSLSGKAVSFLGPLALGWATESFASQRAGMATIIGFFLIGLAGMATVRETNRV